MRKMMKFIAAVLAVSALMAGSAFAGTDKLKVQDATGANTVFSVQDDGITTVNNKQALDTSAVFYVKDTSGKAAMTVYPSGRLDLGVNTGQYNIQTFAGDALGSLPGVRPVITGLRGRGTVDSPTAVRLNDKLGTMSFGGWDGAAFTNGALMEIFVDGAVSVGSVPSRFSIVTGSSASSRAERIVVKADGKVGVGTNAPTSIFQVVGLPVYETNAAAIGGGLTAGAFYRTSTGVLMVVY